MTTDDGNGDGTERRWEPDRPYCPTCNEEKWSWEREDNRCDDCDSQLQDRWPTAYYYKHLAKRGLFITIAATILVGPWVVGLYELVTTPGPLVGYETITVTRTETQMTGRLSDAMGYLSAGIIIWLFVLIAGVMPRGM